MERRIGDVFECGGVRLRVERSKDGCDGCFLIYMGNCDSVMGKCLAEVRGDGCDVMAVPVEGLREVSRTEFTGKNLNDLAGLACVRGFDRDNEEGTWAVKYADEGGRVRFASGEFVLVQMNDGTGRTEEMPAGLAHDGAGIGEGGTLAAYTASTGAEE